MSPILRRALPFAVIGVAWAALTHRVWALGESYFLRDFWVNYVPTRAAMREALFSGEWFLWNPWIGGGLPTVPDPCTSVFYPLSWPLLLLPDQGFAYSLLVAAHLLVAWAGTYLLARRWVEAWPALAAGASFALGGLMLSNLSNGQFQLAYAWAPLWFGAFLSLLDRLEAGRPLSPMVLAVAVLWAMQLLASDPQIAYQQGLAIPFLLGGRAWEKRWPWAWVGKALGGSALAVLGAVLLSLPQLWPMAESLSQVDRQSLTVAESAQWSLHPLRAWELVLPLPWGELTPTTTFWGKALVIGPYHNFYFGSLYLSALLLPLAALGLRGARRAALPVAVGALLLLVASLGQATFLHAALRAALPLWEIFRYPERLLVLPSLGAALLLGRGLQALPELARPRAWGWLALPAGVALLAWLQPGWLGEGGETPQATPSIHRAALHVWGVALLALAALWLSPSWRRGALSGLVIVELFWVGSRLHATWTLPSQPPLVSEHRGRLLVMLQDVAAASAALPPRPAVRRAFEASLVRPNLGAMHGIRALNAVSSLRLNRTNQLMRAVGIEEAAQRFATSALVGRAGLPLRLYQPEQTLPHGLALYRPRTPVAEVRCVSRWATARSSHQAVSLFPQGPVLEGAPPAADAPAQEVPCTLEARRSSRELEVRLAPKPFPVMVMVRESYYPGWEVRTGGGATAEAQPADLAFLGTVVAPGETAVTFRYQPGWQGPSLAVFGLSWAGVLGAAARLWARSRKRKET